MQRSRRFLRSRVLMRLGVVSYAFYLYHLTVVQEVASETPDDVGRLGFTLAVSLPLTLALACASYYVVERPLLRLKFRRPRRGPRSGAGGQASSTITSNPP
jgi:peptidoglycan/LPS O-acetylase OafA/YrhL